MRLSAVVFVSALLGSSCGDDAPEWTPLPPLDYGEAPAAVDADAFETATPIKHVVFVIKENRTFDNMFGLFPGANGVTVGIDQGEPRTLTPAVDRLEMDIRHCYDCALKAWNEGKMDGFATISETADEFAYTQYQPGRPSELLALGLVVRAGGQLLRERAGAVVPQPSVHDRRAIGRDARERVPGHRRAPRAAPGHRPVQGVGLRLDGERLRGRRRQRGRREEGAAVLRLPHRGRPAERGEDPVGLLRGHPVPERLPLVRLRRDPPRPGERGLLADAHLPGRRVRRACRARGCCRPSRG